MPKASRLVAVKSGVARRDLVEMTQLVRVPHHIDCGAKAMPAHPADDDGIKMIECPEKPVDEPNTVQALVHVDAETYWVAFLIASIKSFPRNGLCKNATGPIAET